MLHAPDVMKRLLTLFSTLVHTTIIVQMKELLKVPKDNIIHDMNFKKAAEASQRASISLSVQLNQQYASGKFVFWTDVQHNDMEGKREASSM